MYPTIISQRWNAKACGGNKDINETERITKEKYKRVNGIFSLQVSLASNEKDVFRLLFLSSTCFYPLT